MNMNSTIRWDKYFDRIFCVHYSPQCRKMPRLMEELKRVGILDSGIFTMRFTNPNPYAEVIFNNYNKANCPNVGCVNLGMEMLSIMNEAMGCDHDRILILENDVAFLKDLGYIEKTLENMPNVDLVQFDKFIVPNGTDDYRKSVKERGSGMFFDPQGDVYYSGACFALNAKGIAYEQDFLSNSIHVPDATFANSVLSRAIAITNMAIQVVYSNTITVNMYGVNSHHDGYMRGGVDYSLYNLPDGYSYGSAL